ncbi:MAG: SPOR domain-containing protein [Magnetococcales bacterium]|nr:SPOR domain-containing protein [Magnetococcales bacterium]
MPQIQNDDKSEPSVSLSHTLKTIRNGLQMRPQRGWGVVFALVYWSMVGAAGVTATMPIISLFKSPTEAESGLSQQTETYEGDESSVAGGPPPVPEMKEAVQVTDLESPDAQAGTASPTPATPESAVSEVDLAELQSQDLEKLAESSPASSAPTPAAVKKSTTEDSATASTPDTAAPDASLESWTQAVTEQQTAPDQNEESVEDGKTFKGNVDDELAAAGIEIVELALLEAEEAAAKARQKKGVQDVLSALPQITKLPPVQAGRHFVLVESSPDAARVQAATAQLSALGITPLTSGSTYLEQRYTHVLTGPFATSGASIQAARLLTEQTRLDTFPLIANKTHQPGEQMDPTKALIPPDDFPVFQDGHFMIVAGSFTSAFNLAQTQNLLTGYGILHTVEKTDVKGRTFQRVLVGPFATHQQAELGLPILQMRLQLDARVIKLETPRKAVRLWQPPEKRALLAARQQPVSPSKSDTSMVLAEPPKQEEILPIHRGQPPNDKSRLVQRAEKAVHTPMDTNRSAQQAQKIVHSPKDTNKSAQQAEDIVHTPIVKNWTVQQGEKIVHAPVTAPNPWETQETDLTVAKDVTGQYAVLVGVFNHQSDADHTLNQLTREGVKYFLKEADVGGRRFIQVLVGPFNKREEAKTVADQVRDQTGLLTYCIGI